jgi:hypothetical protein
VIEVRGQEPAALAARQSGKYGVDHLFAIELRERQATQLHYRPK